MTYTVKWSHEFSLKTCVPTQYTPVYPKHPLRDTGLRPRRYLTLPSATFDRKTPVSGLKPSGSIQKPISVPKNLEMSILESGIGLYGENIYVGAIPEPTSGLLMLLGIVGLALRRRKAVTILPRRYRERRLTLSAITLSVVSDPLAVEVEGNLTSPTTGRQLIPAVPDPL